jgi:hypothetical protein
MDWDQLQKELAAQWHDPQPERALDICRGHDLLGLGGRRIVLRSGQDEVVKLAWREAGVLDNEIEWRLWQGAEPELSGLLCPTLGISPEGSSLQALCLPVSYEALGQEGLEAMQRLAGWGIADVAVNLGILDQRLVCYDYCQIRGDLYHQLFA